MFCMRFIQCVVNLYPLCFFERKIIMTETEMQILNYVKDHAYLQTTE